MVTWGHSNHGRDISTVSNASHQISQMFSTKQAFAALKSDGSLTAWGQVGYGAQFAHVASDLSSGVKEVYPQTEHFVR